jgi:hypothetical protein
MYFHGKDGMKDYRSSLKYLSGQKPAMAEDEIFY